MLLQLGALVLILEVCNGSFVHNSLEYWHSSFTNRMEHLLKNEVSGISSQCREHLLYYIHGLKSEELWAMKMFDAGVKHFPSGGLEGNLIDLGSFDECLNIEHYTDEVQILGTYCIGRIFFNINSTRIPKFSTLARESPGANRLANFMADAQQISALKNSTTDIYLAKCFPSACPIFEMEKIYTEIGSKITFDERLCQTKSDQPVLDVGAIAAISIFGLILLTVIIATGYDVVFYYLEKESQYSILIAFSAFKHGRNIISTSNSSSEIACLHGIRAISSIFVAVLHKFVAELSFPVRNVSYFYEWINEKPTLIYHALFLSVDTFFLLSGLLVAYNHMAATTKGIKFNIIVHYIKRYLRLTPVLIVWIVFNITLLKYMGSGPIFPLAIQYDSVKNCEMYWLDVVLYIQNIYGREKAMCIYPCWYLSTDMQLFILSPFPLIPLTRWAGFTLSVAGVLAMCSIITCFVLGWFFELNPYPLKNEGVKSMNYYWYYYFPIYTRASSWLIGITLGYIIFKSKETNAKVLFSKVVNRTLWVFSLVLLCTCVLAGHEFITGEYQKLANSLHMALVRPVWVIAVAWIIFACANGDGGPVNWFLSLPIFQVLSKLSYTFYVVHQAIEQVTTAQMRSVSNFSNFQTMYTFCGDFVLTLVVALVITLTIELPINAISKRLLEQKR